MKIRPLGAQLLHAKRMERRMSIPDDANNRFLNFATVLSKQLVLQNVIIRDIDMDAGLQPYNSALYLVLANTPYVYKPGTHRIGGMV
jgi:hypothetical protein